MRMLDSFQPLVDAELMAYGISPERIKWVTGANGKVYFNTGKVIIPYPTNVKRLAICFHEIGHTVYGSRDSVHSYVKEYEAELFALKMLRKHRINKLYPEAFERYRVNAKGYVLMWIAKEYSQGLSLDSIKPKIRTFCGVDFETWEGYKVIVTNWNHLISDINIIKIPISIKPMKPSDIKENRYYSDGVSRYRVLHFEVDAWNQKIMYVCYHDIEYNLVGHRKQRLHLFASRMIWSGITLIELNEQIQKG